MPDTILLISQNDEIAYHFRSEWYYKEIHKYYYSSPSDVKDNLIINDEGAGWMYSYETIDYGKEGFSRIKELINLSSFIPVDVDVYNIIALAERFYKGNKNSTKKDFLNEIRKPSYFKYLNPYTKKIDDNSEFGYILDKFK